MADENLNPEGTETNLVDNNSTDQPVIKTEIKNDSQILETNNNEPIDTNISENKDENKSENLNDNKSDEKLSNGRGVKKGSTRGPYKKKDGTVNSEIKSEKNSIDDPSKNNTPKDDLGKLEDWMKNYEKVTDDTVLTEAQKKVKEEHDKNLSEIKNKQADENEKIIRDANAELMNGGMLLAVCDFFFPMFFKFVHKKFLKNNYTHLVKHKDVILTPDQVEDISPIADAAAKIIFAKINPLILFTAAMGMMYGTNYRLALDDAEENELKRIAKEEKENKK